MGRTVRQVVNRVVNLSEGKLQLPVLRSYPRYIDIVLTKSCNLKCIFCKDYETKGAQKVSLENFETIARQLFPTAYELRICSGGEPYLHRGLEDCLRIARRYSVDTFVLSNGMLLKESRIRRIVREELISRHGFSVDGIKAPTVEAIRVNAKLDAILSNIQMLIDVRRKERKETPLLVIYYALMRSNIEELPDAVRYWGEAGIDRVSCNYISLCNDIDHQESLYFHQNLAEKIFEDARKTAAHYPHLNLELPALIQLDEPLASKPRQCKAPWNFVFINTDGRILPCYRSWGVLSMGDVYNDTGEPFIKIWNNSKYKKLRKTVNDDNREKYYSYCAKCERRYGRGDLGSHLGDETWFEHIDLDPSERAKLIEHRKRGGN